MSDTFAKRRREVARELKRRELDCLLVTHPANWYYLTGFTGESGVLVVTSRRHDADHRRPVHDPGQGGVARGPPGIAEGRAVRLGG